MDVRKQIAFDIDTKIAEKIFGSGYRKIYYYLEQKLSEAQFRKVEGSVYQSIYAVDNTRVSYIVIDLIEKKPGLEKCIRDMRVADITDENSLNYLFQYDGTIGRYPDISPRSRMRDDYTR